VVCHVCHHLTIHQLPHVRQKGVGEENGEDGCVTYQGGAEAERFPRGDVPLAVVQEQLTDQTMSVSPSVFFFSHQTVPSKTDLVCHATIRQAALERMFYIP
jgi:hypothetical protein